MPSKLKQFLFLSICFQIILNEKGEYLIGKVSLNLLQFKRRVTLGLLLTGLDADECRLKDKQEARFIQTVLPSADPAAKRKKTDTERSRGNTLQ
jgi:hypothetical protein